MGIRIAGNEKFNAEQKKENRHRSMHNVIEKYSPYKMRVIKSLKKQMTLLERQIKKAIEQI